MLDEERDVFAAFAQRRKLHRDDVQAIEEVLAERGVRDHLREIGVRGGDDPDVDLDRVRVADALELPLLQHAQQLCLERRAHRRDLVEKQRALVRLLETTLAGADGARERAAHVAEELGLEQRFRNRAAVERDEPIRAARAGVMNRPRRELLAGSRLARDEHRAGRARDRLEQLKEIRASRCCGRRARRCGSAPRAAIAGRRSRIAGAAVRAPSSARGAARRTETAW